MVNYELTPLMNNDIPNEITSFLTKDLTNYVIIKDGHIIAKSLEEDFNKVYIDSYEHAIPDKINVFLDSEFVNEYNDDAYTYNIENVNSGLLIHIPKNQVITKTLHVFYIQESIDLVNNTRIILEDNSEFKYFEYLYNVNPSSVNFVSNSIVRENAKLDYSGISKLNEKALFSITRNSYVSRYGQSNYSVAEVNDSNTDSKTNIYLNEKYASGTTKTVAITSNHQEARFTQLVEHLAPETEGYIENYGVSNHNSVLVFEGIGKINKYMKRSIARQSNKGIVLSKNARLDANPLLLIDEFDVEASHGAAIGKIDDDQLYYLMSRGLTLKTAERLIINGFLSPVLKKLTTDELKEDFVLSVENKTQ